MCLQGETRRVIYIVERYAHGTACCVCRTRLCKDRSDQCSLRTWPVLERRGVHLRLFKVDMASTKYSE
jgi:hypothetical protein